MNMVFKIKYRKIGGHYHCDVLSAPTGQATFACLGALILDERDFEALKRGGGQWLFEDVDRGSHGIAQWTITELPMLPVLKDPISPVHGQAHLTQNDDGTETVRIYNARTKAWE